MALIPITNNMTTAQFITAVNNNVSGAGDLVTSGMLWPELLNKINGNYTILNGLFSDPVNTLIIGNGNSFKNSINGNDNEIGLFTKTFEDSYRIAINGSTEPFEFSNNPGGVYYNGVTYICYLAAVTFDPMIIKYTHATKIWSSPVQVGVGNDDHGPPVILIDDLGYIHVFYAAHNSNIKYSRSDNIEDITTWTLRSNPGLSLPADGSYPNVLQLANGTFYLFYRNNARTAWTYKTSTNRGVTWSTETDLINNWNPATASYYLMVRKGAGNTIHLFGHDSVGTTIYRYNQYYMYFDGTNWKNSAGTALTIPIDNTVPADVALIKIYNSSGNITGFPATDLDSSDNPSFIFVEGEATESINCNFKFAKKVGASWIITNIASTKCTLARSALIITTPLIMDVYIEKGGVGTGGGSYPTYGGYIEKWSTIDGGTTWNFIEIVKNNTLLSWHQYIKDRNNLKFVFAEVDSSFDGNPYQVGSEIRVYAYGTFLKYQLINQ